MSDNQELILAFQEQMSKEPEASEHYRRAIEKQELKKMSKENRPD